MEDPIEELVTARRRGATLAWAMRHAPDGDADAALRRAWDASIADTAMRDLVARLHVGVDWKGLHCAPGCFNPRCPGCARNIRARLPPPTFAAILAKPIA